MSKHNIHLSSIDFTKDTRDHTNKCNGLPGHESSIASKLTSLTTEEAKNILCKELREIIRTWKDSSNGVKFDLKEYSSSDNNASKEENDVHRNHLIKNSIIKLLVKYLFQGTNLATLICAISLILVAILDANLPNLEDNHLQNFGTYDGSFATTLGEAMVLIMLLIIWVTIYLVEKILKHQEFQHKTERILDLLNICKIKESDIEMDFPKCSSIVTVLVVRDGRVLRLPVNLLVEGDLFYLRYHEMCPVGACLISTPENKDRVSEVPIRRKAGEFLDEALDPSSWQSTRASRVIDRFFLFRAMESFYPKIFFDLLKSTRPRSLFEHQHHKLVRISGWLTCAVIIISLSINLLRVFLTGDYRQQWVDMILRLNVYVLIPLLPLALFINIYLMGLYSVARLLTLFNDLQKSTTPYDDAQDVDEFDIEAPAPVKDVSISAFSILRKMYRHLRGWECFSQPRTANLMYSLAYMTVICALDREGTVAYSFPTIEQVYFVKDDIPPFDITYDPTRPFGIKFEEREWELYKSSFKPIGLNTLLLTTCRSSKAILFQEPHSKRFHNHLLLRFHHCNCLCSLGRMIGLDDENVAPFTTKKLILSWSTNPSTSTGTIDLLFRTCFSILVEDQGTKSLQLMTEGDPLMILAHCSEYWDGDRIRQLMPKNRDSLMEFYNVSINQGMQVIALTYRPIPTLSDTSQTLTEESPDDLLVIHDEVDDLESEIDIYRLNNDSLPAHEITDNPFTTVTSSRRNFWKRMLDRQILIGLVSLHLEPRKVSFTFFVTSFTAIPSIQLIRRSLGYGRIY